MTRGECNRTKIWIIFLEKIANPVIFIPFSNSDLMIKVPEVFGEDFVLL